MIADFYVCADDENPRYRVPLGTRAATGYDFFTKHGFTLSSCMDGVYILGKNMGIMELVSWAEDPNAAAELLTVIHRYKYEKIELMVTGYPYWDDDWQTFRVDIDGTTVSFLSNNPKYPVAFINDGKYFTVPLSHLLSYFEVDTMFEVMDRLNGFKYGDGWTFEQLRDYFSQKDGPKSNRKNDNVDRHPN